VLWLVPGLALTKSKINSGELTDKYPMHIRGDALPLLIQNINAFKQLEWRCLCDACCNRTLWAHTCMFACGAADRWWRHHQRSV